MATSEIVRGQIAVHNKTLVASTADTVTWADEVQFADVISDGTADVYVATDGNPATVHGANCHRIPAPTTASPVSRRVDVTGGTLSLISSGAVAYSVESVDVV